MNKTINKDIFPKHTYYHINIGWEKKKNEQGDEYEEPRHSFEFIDDCTLQLVTQRMAAEGVIGELTEEEMREIAAFFGDELEGVRQIRLAQIAAYDESGDVNGFTLNGFPMWLDKETRSGLRGRLDSEQAAGKEMTTLWYGTRSISLPAATASGLLRQVEIYAAECFDVTHGHMAAVEQLASVEDVVAYDYTSGYPQKLELMLGDADDF